MWQLVAWSSAKCVERRAIRRVVLLKLWFGEGEDEEHLFLVCPNTQIVREHFCSALPLTHINILTKLMQTMNMVALAKFVVCC
jgi:hypothetical protein